MHHNQLNKCENIGLKSECCILQKVKHSHGLETKSFFVLIASFFPIRPDRSEGGSAILVVSAWIH